MAQLTTSSRFVAATLSGGLAVLAIGLAAPAAQAAIFESFEDFTGTSGTSVSGYAGDGGSGAWTGSSTTVIMVDDGTAYDGDNYLRLADNNSSQHPVTKTFNQLVAMSAEGAHVSFALRRSPYAGQTAALTGANFGIKITDAETPGNTGTEIPNFNVFVTAQGGPEDVGIWFLYEMDIIKLPSNQARITNVSITDTTTDTVVFTSANWFTSGALTANHDALSWLRFFSHGTSQGNVDIDAISVAPIPEPASLMLFGIGCALVGGRRSHRRNA